MLKKKGRTNVYNGWKAASKQLMFDDTSTAAE